LNPAPADKGPAILRPDGCHWPRGTQSRPLFRPPGISRASGSKPAIDIACGTDGRCRRATGFELCLADTEEIQGATVGLRIPPLARGKAANASVKGKFNTAPPHAARGETRVCGLQRGRSSRVSCSGTGAVSAAGTIPAPGACKLAVAEARRNVRRDFGGRERDRRISELCRAERPLQLRALDKLPC